MTSANKRILVTGGRDYSDSLKVFEIIHKLADHYDGLIFIEGGAKGADRMVRQTCQAAGIHYATVPALWNHFGKGAGPKRNAAMLMLDPHICVVFPGGRGTADMARRANDHGCAMLYIE